MTCEQLHEDKKSTAYKNCVAQKKADELNADKIKEEKLKEVIVEEKAPAELSTWQKIKQKASDAFEYVQDVAEDIDTNKRKENLTSLKIEDENFLQDFGYNLNADIRTTGLLDFEDIKLSEFALEDLKLNNKDPDYSPTTLEIQIKKDQILKNSLQYNTGEKKTLIESIPFVGENVITDTIGDMWQGGVQGINAAGAIENTYDIFKAQGKASDDVVKDWYEQNINILLKNRTSQEMRQFQEEYQKEGGTWFGFFKGLIKNPGALPTVFTSSMATQLGAFVNSDEVRQKAAVGGLGGGIIGSGIPVVGTAIGTVGGSFAGVAKGMELAMSFSEFIFEEAAIKHNGDITKVTLEDVTTLLNDKDVYEKIYKRSDNRSTAIAAIEFASMGLSKGVGTTMARTAKKLKGTVNTAKKINIAATQASIEMGGGALGETVGQVVGGQELNKMDIGLEAFGQLGKAPITIGATLYNINKTAAKFKANNIISNSPFSLADMVGDPSQQSNDGGKKKPPPPPPMSPVVNVFSGYNEGIVNSVSIELIKDPLNYDVLNDAVVKDVKQGKITNDEGVQILQNFKEIVGVVNKIKPLGLANNDLVIEASNLLLEEKKLQQIIKNVDNESLTTPQQEKVNEINDRLKIIQSNENINTKKSGYLTAEGKAINDLVGLKNKDGNFEITKKEWDTKKADEVITKMFNGKLLDKLIKSKITQEMLDLPKFSSEDFVSATVLELIPHIRNFNPEENNSLTAWVNSQVINKTKNALKKGKSGTDQVFTSDVTEARGVTDSDTISIEDKIDLENVETKQQTKAIDKLRKITGITPEETQETGDKISGSKIRIEPVKGIQNPSQRDVGKAGTLLFGDKIIEAMGGVLGTKDNKLGNYTTFLELQGQDILDVLSSPDVNEIKNTKLKDLYNPKKIDRVGGVQNVGGAGKGIFKYSNPSVADLITWATDSSLAPTTKIARQRTLADILGNILGRVSTIESVKTKEGKENFKEKQKVQGNKIKPDTIEKLIKDIDVSLRNFDGILPMGITPKMIGTALKGALRTFDRAIKAGKTLTQAIKDAVKKINSIIKNADIASVIGRFFTEAFTTIKNQGKAIKKATNDVLVWAAASTGKIDTVLRLSGINGIYNLKIPADRIAYKKVLREKIFPLMPRAFWNNKKMFTEFPAKTGTKELNLSNKEISDILDSMDDSEFGEPVIGVTSYVRKKYSDVFGVTGESTLQALNDVAGIEFNRNNMLIHEELWKRINEVLVDSNGKIDKNTARGIGNWLKGVGNDTTHWHKIGAEVLGADPNSVSLHWEHAMPATAAYIYLINSILNPNANFKSTYELVKANYKVIAIDTKDNKKIDKAGLTRNMPEWWTILDNWWDRYFNLQVAEIDGGIGIETVQLANGKTLGQEYGIANSKGNAKEIIIESKIKINKTINKGKEDIENNPDLIPKEPTDLSKDFNVILEETEGIGQDKVYSDIGARKSGSNKGRYKFFMPPGAQDFELLIYNFLGKGKVGEKQKRFFEENLFKPYSKGIAKMENYRAQLMDDFEALKKLMPGVNKKLGDKIKDLEYTNSQAIRVFLWNKSGFDIPGISKTDKNKLLAYVNKNPDLIEFTNGLTALSKQDQWVKPDAYWDSGSIVKDVNDLVSKIGRKQQLEQFVANADVIFSKDNLNKIEAVYGIELREAIQDILYRMKNGTNRPSNADRLTNSFTNWLNNSVGAIMFMNTKSATLQLLSMLNYINHRENNPIAVAKAVLNIKQYGKDVYTILSSPKIKRRFAGEGRGVNEAEISSAVSGSTNKMSAMISYLLKIGFTPTRAADAAAIGLGGAPYYRNKINAYKKQGLSDKEAEAKAWDDFSETTEKFQQSSDPMLISQQQASVLGRFILAFQNTPMQYTRSMVKDGKDLTNRRRISGLTQSESDRVYISRILYYGAVQNFMFAALSNALFALVPGFDDEEKELDKEQQLIQNKQIRIINNMIDTVLRGSGVYGAIVSTLKNVALKYNQEEGKTPFNKDHRNTLLEIMNLSPPVGSKFRKINNALKIKDWDSDIIEKRGWDVMMDGRVNLSPSYSVFGNVVEGVTNIPLARMTEEVARLSEMLDSRNTSMQRIALGLGWRTWDVNADNEEHDLIKIETKQNKEQKRKQKVIDDRAEKKRLAEEKKYEGKTDEEIKLIKQKDSLIGTNRSEQIKSLLDLGLTKKEIKELKYEDDRVNKIIELTNK